MGNSYRQTEFHFRKYEDVLAHFIADPENFIYEVPIPSEQRVHRIIGRTVAVNLTFAMRWFLDQVGCHSSYFDLKTAQDFHEKYLFRGDPREDYFVRCYKRLPRGVYAKPRFLENPVAPKDESKRIAGLSLNIADLELFRAVLHCYKNHVITWPISFSGNFTTIHEDYVAELGEFVELCYVDHNDTTVLVPNR